VEAEAEAEEDAGECAARAGCIGRESWRRSSAMYVDADTEAEGEADAVSSSPSPLCTYAACRYAACRCAKEAGKPSVCAVRAGSSHGDHAGGAGAGEPEAGVGVEVEAGEGVEEGTDARNAEYDQVMSCARTRRWGPDSDRGCRGESSEAPASTVGAGVGEE
jgi:hypothetical protein